MKYKYNIKNFTNIKIKMVELGKKYFPEEVDKKTFLNLLETLDYVKIIFVSRKKYKKMWENFLVETWQDKHWKHYNLYLPNTLNSNEIPYLVYTLKNRFNLELADKLVNQVLAKSKLALYLLIKEWENIDNLKKYSSKDIQFEKRIKEVSLFSVREKIKELKNKYRTKSIKNIKLKKEDIDNLFDLDLEKLFFEKWKNLVKYGLYTLTQAEQEKIDFSKEWHYKHIETNKLDKEEKLLRKAIWIDKWKKKLQQVRKKWNKKIIEKVEFKAASTILKELHKYPYINNKENNWYQLSKIVSSKEMYCVWYSIVAHTFLSELWIKHKWALFPDHVALELYIWWKKYLLDATASNLLKIRYLDNFIINEPRKILLAVIYNNKGNDLSILWRYEEAIKMFDKVLELEANYTTAYFNKGNDLSILWRYEEAIKMFDKILELEHNDIDALLNKGSDLFNLWKYKKALNIFNKVLSIKPNDIDALLMKWYSLHKLRLNKKAQEIFTKAYKENPTETKEFLTNTKLKQYKQK